MRRLLVVACLVLTAAAVAAPANAGESFWRIRAISISPDDGSEVIPGTDSVVKVDSQIAPELDVTWMFARHWGFELALTAARHELEARGGSLGGADLGSVWLLPPTLMLQYHFLPGGSARPYLGLGVTVATFSNYNVSADLEAIGVEKLSFSDSVEPAAQIGIDFDVADRWFLNLDVKYAKIETDVRIDMAGVPGDPLGEILVDVDPWIFGIGFGYRY